MEFQEHRSSYVWTETDCCSHYRLFGMGVKSSSSDSASSWLSSSKSVWRWAWNLAGERRLGRYCEWCAAIEVVGIRAGNGSAGLVEGVSSARTAVVVRAGVRIGMAVLELNEPVLG